MMRISFLAVSLASGIVALVSGANAQVPSSAQQQRPDYWLYGPADDSCGTWLQNKETYERRTGPTTITNVGAGILYGAELNWVFGFISGVGMILAEAPEHKGLAQTDTAAIKVWMDKYCSEHPLDDVEHAALVLVGELAKRK